MTIMRTISKIIVMLLFCFNISSKRHDRPRKMVIDTDPGGDDALAIMLAVMHEAKTHEIEILAITVSYGNTILENAEKNLLKILTVANSKVPVYAGAQRPLLLNEFKPDDYFGDDGFGDFNFTQKITAKIDRSKHASVALVDLVKQYPGEITVVTLGPLTTIATAITLEPNFLHLTKQHIMMGASIKSNKVEFNFGQDPESDWIVLNNTNKPSVILPTDTIHSHAFSQDELKNLYNSLDKSIASFLYQAERKALEKQNNTWLPSDGITMAIALQPDIVIQSFETNLTPVLVGARGSVVVNSDNHTHNAKVITGFDKFEFKHLLLKLLS